MSKIGDAWVAIKSRSEELNAGLSAAKRKVSGFATHAQKLAVIAGGAFAAIGAVRIIGKAIKAAMAQQQAERNLGAALKAHGDNVDALLPRYKKFASALQTVTTYGDELTLQMMTNIRNLGVQSDRMEAATQAAIGLAKALKLDADSAARYTALAMQGEFTILQRYVPALRTAASESDKVRIVTDMMAKGFEQASQTTDTVEERWKQLRNSFWDLSERIVLGSANVDQLSDALLRARVKTDMLADSSYQLRESFGARALGWGKKYVQGLSAFFGTLSAEIRGVDAALISSLLFGKTAGISNLVGNNLRAFRNAIKAAKEAPEAMEREIQDRVDAIKREQDEVRKAAQKRFDDLRANLEKEAEAREKAQAKVKKNVRDMEVDFDRFRSIYDAHTDDVVQNEKEKQVAWRDSGMMFGSFAQILERMQAGVSEVTERGMVGMQRGDRGAQPRTALDVEEERTRLELINEIEKSEERRFKDAVTEKTAKEQLAQLQSIDRHLSMQAVFG